ncbi:oligosaccharide flippase family protein [Mycobacterium sp. 20091114027_K0903767]|nr:oligosaccharide flippase family protein [Mycobacterium sp. 20091114027_K0903767]
MASFARNTVLGFASAASIALAGLIGNAITARILGPDKMGTLAYVVWCVTLTASIAALGINAVQQRFIPILRSQDKDAEAQGLVGTTTRWSLAASVISAAALFAYFYWPGKSVLEAHSSTSSIAILGVALAWLICWRVADTYQFYLRGEQQFGELARLSIASSLIKLAVIALGAWFFGIPGALAGYIAGNLLPASRIYRLLRFKPHVAPDLKHEVVRFALQNWAVAMIGYIVFGRTEIVFLERYTGLAAVGLFTAAVTLADMAAQLQGLLLSALLPRFSEQYGMGARDAMQRLYRTTTALLVMLIAPLSLGLAAIAPVLVTLFFGADFAGASRVATVLLIAEAISSFGVTTLFLIQSSGKAGALLITNGIGVIGTIGLGFLLIPRFGLMGAAYSRAIVQVSVVLMETWYVTRRLQIAPPYRALGAITLASVASGAVAHFAVATIGGFASLLVAIPAAVLVYLVVLSPFSVMSKLDPELIHRLVTRLPNRIRPVVSRIF